MTALLLLAFPALLFGVVALAIWLTVREKGAFDAARGETSPEKAAHLEAPSIDPLARREDPGPQLPLQKIAFQTFVGHRDPVRSGSGTVRISGGALLLNGRSRRLFHWRKEDERIPLDRICDVMADGRQVRFVDDLRPLKTPRLLQFASAQAAASFAAHMPTRMSPAGAVLKGETEAFARFLAEGRPWITIGIIIVNLAIYLWGLARATGYPGTPGLSDLGGNLGPVTVQGQWWRLVSSTFLHSGLMHVGINMLALWEAGRVSERLFGHDRYLGAYLTTGVLASIVSINWHQDVLSIGASGAVFGIYGLLMAALALRHDLLPPSVTRRLRNGAIVFVAYSFLSSLGHKGIDHAAHVGGLVAGLALGAILVLPRAKAALAMAATLGFTFLGLWRAHEVNAPYADEGAFRGYFPDFAREEAQLNRRLNELLMQADVLGAIVVADRIDRELVSSWKTISQRLASLTRLVPKSRELRDPLSRYAELKTEALGMVSVSLRSDDQGFAELAGERLREANRYSEEARQILAARTAAKPVATPAASPPPLPLAASLPATRFIAEGHWQEAGRTVLREANQAYPQREHLVEEQALAGYTDDAREALPKLRPYAQSWVLYRWAKDGKNLTNQQRQTMFSQAAEAVRGKTMAASLKADALAHAAIGLQRQGQEDRAKAVMREALEAALQGNEEERGAALRTLPDDLVADTAGSPGPLLPIAEEAARVDADPFHGAFADASLARVWHRLGDDKKAWAWWEQGMQRVARILERSRQTTAESGLAEVAAELGRRDPADRIIDARRGTFVDVLAGRVMVSSARRGDRRQVMRDFEQGRVSCVSSIASGGFALRDVVEIEAQAGDFDAARHLLDAMTGCAPRFVAEGWMALAEAQWKRADGEAAQASMQKGLAVVRAISGRPLDKFEILVLVQAADLSQRMGRSVEAQTLANEAVLRVGQLSPQGIDERVVVLAKAAIVMSQTGAKQRASEVMTLAYQWAQRYAKDSNSSELAKARMLASVGTTLAQMH
jgi:membrane associated rhomboid family serine protease